MAIIVVGGNARNTGKTSVITGLISHLPCYNWTAFKITPHAHCGNASQFLEEQDRNSSTDTSRFLAAGAVRAFLVCTHSGTLAQVLPAIRKELCMSENAIIESNSILRFIKPDIYLTILDPATSDFKTSAQHFLDLADAVLIKATGARPVPHWRQIEGKPQFIVTAPSYLTPDVVDFVKKRLAPQK